MWRQWDSFGGSIINEQRGYYQFDTSDANTGIPAGNIVTKVELLYNYRSGPISTAGTWQWDWHIYAGQFIGAALDGNAGEWNGGSLVQFGIFSGGDPPQSNFWIDLEDIGVLLDRSGITDFKIVDQSQPNPAEDAGWSMELWNGPLAARRGKLRITHFPPAVPSDLSVLSTPHAGI